MDKLWWCGQCEKYSKDSISGSADRYTKDGKVKCEECGTIKHESDFQVDLLNWVTGIYNRLRDIQENTDQ